MTITQLDSIVPADRWSATSPYMPWSTHCSTSFALLVLLVGTYLACLDA